jgi:2-C-methyl-D-erythritol 4-phosphate cytidylyltransferase
VSAAIIVAAGQGTRMGTQMDKLFLEVAGWPVVAHVWRRFDATADIEQIVLVIRAGSEQAFETLARRIKPRKTYRLVIGGAERQDSVWEGLRALADETELVAIQDGARPCTREEVIKETLEAARLEGAAVAAQRLTDTIKESRDGKLISRHLDRSRLWSVQTPQCFRTEVIRRALAAVREKGLHVTDDTAACELIGQPVRLVESRHPNPKLTSPGDIPFVEALLHEMDAPSDFE